MKTNKKKAKLLEKEVQQNLNDQTISSKIHAWLTKLGIIGSAESPNKIEFIWSGTQAEYDALDEVDDETLYFIE